MGLAKHVISDDSVYLCILHKTFRHPVISPEMLHVEAMSTCNLMRSRLQNITNYNKGAPLNLNYLGTKGLGNLPFFRPLQKDFPSFQY